VVVVPVVWRTLALLPALACLVTAPPAHAYEDQFGLSVDATYGRVVPDSSRPDGLLLGASGSLGLDDTWTARMRLAYGAQLATERNEETLQLGLASGELLYLFDILEWVPYVGIGVDGILLNDSKGFGSELGCHVVAGLDWLATRELVVGLDVRGVVLASAWETRPFYLAVTLSLGWLFQL